MKVQAAALCCGGGRGEDDQVGAGHHVRGARAALGQPAGGELELAAARPGSRSSSRPRTRCRRGRSCCPARSRRGSWCRWPGPWPFFRSIRYCSAVTAAGGGELGRAVSGVEGGAVGGGDLLEPLLAGRHPAALPGSIVMPVTPFLVAALSAVANSSQVVGVGQAVRGEHVLVVEQHLQALAERPHPELAVGQVQVFLHAGVEGGQLGGVLVPARWLIGMITWLCATSAAQLS